MFRKLLASTALATSVAASLVAAGAASAQAAPAGRAVQSSSFIAADDGTPLYYKD